MSYLALAQRLEHWEISEYTIRYALIGRGYARYVALAKPPLSDDNKRIRLAWAEAHVSWGIEEWRVILWTDETWVTGGRHRKCWVTRMPGEELEDNCLVDKVRRKRGWMFWACFSGDQKGPCLFWEKQWKSINKERYCERIVPMVDDYLRTNPT